MTDVIVHPSVFYHDDTSSQGLLYINDLAGRHELRDFRRRMATPWGDLFWNRDFRKNVDLTLKSIRILVCGAHGIGKSGLINKIAGSKVVRTCPITFVTVPTLLQD
jgi:ribosome biogenesis GTPase A